MTEKSAYVGSVGPIDFDDGDVYAVDSENVEGGRFPQVYLEDNATEDHHAVRFGQMSGYLTQAIAAPLVVADITDPSTELASKDASALGNIIICYEIESNRDSYTIYAWDTGVSLGADVPYVVAGDGGYWIAIGGAYNALSLSLDNALTVGGALSVTGATTLTGEVSCGAGLTVTDAPSASTDVVRLGDITGQIESYGVKAISVDDIEDPSDELNQLSGESGRTPLVLCYEVSATLRDHFTLYAWDSAAAGTGEVPPYTVDGLTGMWVAIGGRYHYTAAVGGTTNCADDLYAVSDFHLSGEFNGAVCAFTFGNDAGGTTKTGGSDDVDLAIGDAQPNALQFKAGSVIGLAIEFDVTANSNDEDMDLLIEKNGATLITYNLDATIQNNTLEVQPYTRGDYGFGASDKLSVTIRGDGATGITVDDITCTIYVQYT